MLIRRARVKYYIYLFENKGDRDDEKIDRAMKVFIVPNGFYDVYEHYPDGVKEDKHSQEHYFLLNGSQPKSIYFDVKVKDKDFYLLKQLSKQYTIKTLVLIIYTSIKTLDSNIHQCVSISGILKKRMSKDG